MDLARFLGVYFDRKEHDSNTDGRWETGDGAPARPHREQMFALAAKFADESFSRATALTLTGAVALQQEGNGIAAPCVQRADPRGNACGRSCRGAIMGSYGNAVAQEDSWTKMFEFLDNNL